MPMKDDWSNKSLLIVEDDDISGLLLTEGLKKTKIKTTLIKTVIDFFRVIKSEKYDLILMDYNLSDRQYDGIDLVSYMKENNIKIPTIIQSGSAFEDRIVDNMEHENIMYKPIKFDLLYSKIRKIFGL